MIVTSALHAHESAPAHRKAGISALAGFLGFGLLFSPYIIAGRDSAPRLTDLVGGILWLLVPAVLLTGHRLHRARSLRLLVVVWLGISGLTLMRMPDWRALGIAQVAVTVLTLVVVVAKPFDWLDLEPSLGFALALVYLWIGVALVRAARRATTA